MADQIAYALQKFFDPDVAKPKIFTGEENIDIREFLEDYEEYMESRNKGDEANMKLYLKHFLGGRAKLFYRNEKYTFQGLATFADYKQKLVEEFNRENNDLESFMNRMQGTSENPFKYVEEKRRLAFYARVDPNSKDVIKAVIRGLKEEIADRIYMLNNNTYVDLKENIHRATQRISEDRLSMIGEVNCINFVSKSGTSQIPLNPEHPDSLEDRLRTLEDKFKSWDKNFNDWGDRIESLVSDSNINQKRQNFQPPRNAFQNFRQDSRRSNPYIRRCYECDDPKHLQNRCPRRLNRNGLLLSGNEDYSRTRETSVKEYSEDGSSETLGCIESTSLPSPLTEKKNNVQGMSANRASLPDVHKGNPMGNIDFAAPDVSADASAEVPRKNQSEQSKGNLINFEHKLQVGNYVSTVNRIEASNFDGNFSVFQGNEGRIEIATANEVVNSKISSSSDDSVEFADAQTEEVDRNQSNRETRGVRKINKQGSPVYSEDQNIDGSSNDENLPPDKFLDSHSGAHKYRVILLFDEKGFVFLLFLIIVLFRCFSMNFLAGLSFIGLCVWTLTEVGVGALATGVMYQNSGKLTRREVIAGLSIAKLTGRRVLLFPE